MSIEDSDLILTGLTFIEAADSGNASMLNDIMGNFSAADLLLGVTKSSVLMFRINAATAKGNLSLSESITRARNDILHVISSE